MTFLTTLRPLVSVANSYSGTGSFVGATEDVSQYATATTTVWANDVGTLTVEYSPDGVNWDVSQSFNTEATISKSTTTVVAERFYRVSFSTGIGTVVRLSSVYNPYGAVDKPNVDYNSGIADQNTLRVAIAGNSFDSASRFETVVPITTGDYRAVDNDAFLHNMDIYTNGGGSAVHSPSTNSYTLAVDNTNGAQSAITASYESHPYFSGKSQVIEFSMFNFATVASSNIGKRAGYFYSAVFSTPNPTDPVNQKYDGIFLHSFDGIVSLEVWREGTSVLYAPSSTWIDPLDGTGISRITIDWDKFNVFIFDFLYLGGASLKFYCFIGGEKRLIYSFAYTNNVANTIIGSPQLPMRYEIYKTAGTAISQMNVVNSAAITNGSSRTLTGYPHSIDTGFTDIDIVSGSFRAILALRLRKTRPINRTITTLIKGLFLASNSQNAIFTVRVYINPTINPAGGSFSWLPLDVFEYALGNNTTPIVITGGDTIFSGTGVGRASVETDLPIFRRLGAPIDLTLDWGILVVCATASTNMALSGALNFEEIM